MKIAIIDDTDYKIKDINLFLQKRYPDSEIRIARSFHTALDLLEKFFPDLIILDMHLPTSETPDGHFEGRWRMFGGKDLLSEISLMDLESKVIIVTQFDRFPEGSRVFALDELINIAQKQHDKILLGGIYFDSENKDWEKALELLLKKAQI